MNSGSLGHGLSVSVGLALAERMNGSGARVYVVMGTANWRKAPFGKEPWRAVIISPPTSAPWWTATDCRFPEAPKR